MSTSRKTDEDKNTKVVLLPGLDGTGLLFEPLLSELPNDIEVCIISYPTDRELSYQELVEYVLTRLPKDEFILVAESFSGPIAYQLVQRNILNLQSVVFVATFLLPPHPYLLRLSHLFSPRLITLFPNYFLKVFLLGRESSPQLISLFKRAIKEVEPHVLSNRLREILKLTKMDSNCVTADVPVSYIQAQNDKLVNKNTVNQFKKIFVNLDVYQFKGSHFILQTNPVACCEIIKSHISR